MGRGHREGALSPPRDRETTIKKNPRPRLRFQDSISVFWHDIATWFHPRGKQRGSAGHVAQPPRVPPADAAAATSQIPHAPGTGGTRPRVPSPEPGTLRGHGWEMQVPATPKTPRASPWGQGLCPQMVSQAVPARCQNPSSRPLAPEGRSLGNAGVTPGQGNAGAARALRSVPVISANPGEVSPSCGTGLMCFPAALDVPSPKRAQGKGTRWLPSRGTGRRRRPPGRNEG